MEHQSETIISYLVSAWETQLTRATNLINKLTDEQLSKPIKDGRNTGTYLLGHLTAIHDNMLPLLGNQERLHPQLEEVFVKNPDQADGAKPSVSQLRTYWNEVNAAVSDEVASLDLNEWLSRHNAVSEEDFLREPHRNKLSILLSRTTHLAYHLGQLTLLKDQYPTN